MTQCLSPAKEAPGLDVQGNAQAPSPDPATRTTVDALRILKDVPSHLDPTVRETLNGLCRSIAVYGTVFEAYTAEWRKLPETKELPVDQWERVIEALLNHAVCNDGLEPDDRGFTLKCLNAAFQALDLAGRRSGNQATVQRLRTRAEQCLPDYLHREDS